MNPELYQELVRQISRLQKQVDGLVKPENGRWLDWTPAITQGVAVTCNITFARYITISNVVHLEVLLAVTSAGTVGQPITVAGLPTAIQPTNTASDTHVIGSGVVKDTGTAYYQGSLIAFGANALRFVAHNMGGQIGNTPSFGLANGDIIGFQAVYER